MIPQTISIEARTIADRLLEVPVGETVSLDTLSELVGINLTHKRHLFYAAIRLAQREAGAIFACHPRKGYQRLAAEEVAKTVGTNARDKVRRSARRARRTIEAGISGANDLPPEEQRRAAAEISSLALLEHVARNLPKAKEGEAPMKPEPVAITARRLFGGTP